MSIWDWGRRVGDRITLSRRHPDLDLSYYRNANLDLNRLNDAQLARHYAKFGKVEGRSANLAEAQAREAVKIAALEAQFGAPPDDFDWREYVSLNPDLAYANDSAYAAIAH